MMKIVIKNTPRISRGVFFMYEYFLLYFTQMLMISPMYI